MTSHLLEGYIKQILQKNVSFNINGKTVKEGKLILYNIKDFFLSFHIVTSKNQTKIYEIPVPYRVHRTKDVIRLDYGINNIIKKDAQVKLIIASLYKKIGKKSKLFDNIVDIKVNTSPLDGE